MMPDAASVDCYYWNIYYWNIYIIYFIFLRSISFQLAATLVFLRFILSFYLLLFHFAFQQFGQILWKRLQFINKVKDLSPQTSYPRVSESRDRFVPLSQHPTVQILKLGRSLMQRQARKQQLQVAEKERPALSSFYFLKIKYLAGFSLS